MTPLSLLLAFLAFYPVVTGAAWMVGGVLFRVLEGRPDPATPPGGWPGVTVLVPAYNEEQVIARCVTALRALAYGGDLEILILNDGSADGTVAVARAAAGDDPRVTVLDDGVNLGKADRLNDGMRRARHDLVLVTDADTHLHPDAVRHLTTRILRSPRYAAVAGSPRVTNRGGVIPTLQMLEAASLIGLMRRTHALAGRVGTVAGVLGLFRRDAVLAVGGYDPRMATEDIELTWRLLEAGHLTGFAPHALVGMQVPGTLRSIWAQRTRWARGQGEVLRTHARTVVRPRHWALWPIALEALLSYVWVLTMLVATTWGVLHWITHPGDTRFRWMLAWGVGIAVVAVLQIALAIVVERRLDPRLPYACFLLPLYPLAYWSLNALAALTSQTRGLLRGPRKKRVTWDLPRTPS
ncbi:glycosyltransferase family 2 protein [Streptomyces indicus]|uniref:Biofilm PGA synthesis N-glycosyltransferase PgaC n=1 Tax=Streptomyces indicus TaxID=417292 RepID=A0A1G9H299_9ACTN|nr:glycosyltransferase [Streptomyces indicus]SDL06982.1 biofilm PGA synthesis N-glycosyltransferase PgaC [Streptomyces indicus]